MSVSKIYGLTDRTPLALAVHAKQLRTLNISGCWRLTDYGIRYGPAQTKVLTSLINLTRIRRMLGEYCLQLSKLIVGDCRDVTEDGLKQLRSRGIVVAIPEDARAPRALFHGLELRLQV